MNRKLSDAQRKENRKVIFTHKKKLTVFNR